MTSDDKKKKKKIGGLVRTVALNPLDPAHLVHNGCDEGLKLLQIGFRRQGPEDVSKAEARIAEGHPQQHLFESSRTDLARLVGQLLWDPLPESLEGRRHAFEEQGELGAGWEGLIGGIPEILHPQLRQLLVDVCGNICKTLRPPLHSSSKIILGGG